MREFLHNLVDGLCDFFKLAWEKIVQLVKTAVRFFSNVCDFFKDLFSELFDDIVSGLKKIYVFRFERMKHSTTKSTNNNPDEELCKLFDKAINAAENQAGGIAKVNVGLTQCAVVADKETGKVEKVQFFKVDPNTTDPGMGNIQKALNQQKGLVKVVNVS